MRATKPALKTFLAQDAGAVNVDWIVLTAAVVFMGIGAATFVGSAVPELGQTLKNFMESYDVGSLPS